MGLLITLCLIQINFNAATVVNGEENTDIPADIQNINNVSYFLIFDPQIDGNSTTEYFLNFDHLGGSQTEISVEYENPALSYTGENYNFTGEFIANGSFIINSVTDPYLIAHMDYQASEFFANTSILDDQRFRIDEFLLWQHYLDDGYVLIDPYSKNRTFEFMGSQTYDKYLNTTFDVYHFQAKFSFLGGGCS